MHQSTKKETESNKPSPFLGPRIPSSATISEGWRLRDTISFSLKRITLKTDSRVRTLHPQTFVYVCDYNWSVCPNENISRKLSERNTALQFWYKSCSLLPCFLIWCPENVTWSVWTLRPRQLDGGILKTEHPDKHVCLVLLLRWTLNRHETALLPPIGQRQYCK